MLVANARALLRAGAGCMQSGVEVAVFIKKAMEKAGVTSLAQLKPEAVCAALREYEVTRSHRVAFVIRKARRFGNTFMRRNWLVSSAMQDPS